MRATAIRLPLAFELWFWNYQVKNSAQLRRTLLRFGWSIGNKNIEQCNER
ncbi:hypothetical protein LMG19083_04930 [Ralstonia psammae]|uniref:Uncharacterized protein n=1 Tax=Ralstonia psammae TaxID=3058598 RepID=A0ABM9K0G0_9RALS|nr:hypothetical protein LMG19083_04930 [Ralstonia sp. LMG 19083]